MIERKEKSPRLLEQTMGDMTKNPSTVYPNGSGVVKYMQDSDFWEERAKQLNLHAEILRGFVDTCPEDFVNDRKRMKAIEEIIAGMEADAEDAKKEARWHRERESRETALDEAEREAEYRRAAL